MYDKQFDKTLHLYLRLKKGEVFRLIQQHNLYASIRDKVLLLLQFDLKPAVNLLVDHYMEIPINAVVSQLKDDEPLLYGYLSALFDKHMNEAPDHHELMLKLYAKYDYPKLLPFLKMSQSIPLHKALEICEEKKLYPEMVFIHGRMGNTSFALNLIIEHIRDVRQAIEFVESQRDDQLWEQLINQSLKDPNFIGGLLENIGTHIDPILLIKKIPNGMQIPELRDRLVKIISDFNLKRSLREGCSTILKADCVQLQDRLFKKKKRGFRVSNDKKCASCGTSIIQGDMGDSDPCVIFFCNHSYHVRCLQTNKLQQKGAPQEKATDKKKVGQQLVCEICYDAAKQKRYREQSRTDKK